MSSDTELKTAFENWADGHGLGMQRIEWPRPGKAGNAGAEMLRQMANPSGDVLRDIAFDALAYCKLQTAEELHAALHEIAGRLVNYCGPPEPCDDGRH